MVSGITGIVEKPIEGAKSGPMGIMKLFLQRSAFSRKILVVWRYLGLRGPTIAYSDMRRIRYDIYRYVEVHTVHKNFIDNFHEFFERTNAPQQNCGATWC